MNQALRELPIEERIDLVEELWNSIEEDQQSLPIFREYGLASNPYIQS